MVRINKQTNSDSSTVSSTKLPQTKHSSHFDQAKAIFNKRQITQTDEWDRWLGFDVGAPTSSATGISGYKDASRLWKVFLNPTRDNFYQVLDRVITAAQKEGISFEGKLVDDILGKHGISDLDDPTEPKLLIYVTGKDEKEGRSKFVEMMKMLESEFSEEEMKSLAHVQGERKRESGEIVQQWGPSFTRRHTNLIFYSHGGFEESGRKDHLDKLENYFQGENFYLYKNRIDPLLLKNEKLEQIAIDRLKRFVKFQLNRKDDVRTLNKLFEASYLHKYVHAQVLLRKNKPSHEEVASLHNISVHDLQMQRIADCYVSLCKEQKKDLDFSTMNIAKKLGISEEEIASALQQSELLLNKRELLATLGTQFNHAFLKFSESQYGGLSRQEVSQNLDSTSELFRYIKSNFSSFSQPISLIKLFNISQNLEFITSHNNLFDKEHMQLAKTLMTTAEELTGDILKVMELKRRGSVWEMMEAQSTPEKLRDAIAQKTWGVSTLENGTYSMKKLKSSLSNEKIIEGVLERANELKAMVTSAQKNLPKELKCGSKEIDAFYKSDAVPDKKKACQVILQKLDNVIARQKSRLDQIKKGEKISIPLIFHATTKEDILFQIASSEIRHSQATYDGAFVATNPAMLRYGAAVLGLDLGVSFSAELIKTNAKKPFVLPENEPFGLDPKGFRDPKIEKWLGFSESVTVNPKVFEMERKFQEKLQPILIQTLLECDQSLSIDSPEVHRTIEEILSALSQKKLTLSPSENRSEWTPFLRSSKKTYEEFSKKSAATIIAAIKKKSQEAKVKKLCKALESNLDSIWLKLGGNKEGSGIRIKGELQFPTTPYFIGIDDEPYIKSYFEKDPHFQFVGGKEVTSIDSIRKKAREGALQGKKLTAEEQKKLEENVNLHCIPLMEQIIEFDCISNQFGGALLLKEWME